MGGHHKNGGGGGKKLSKKAKQREERTRPQQQQQQRGEQNSVSLDDAVLAEAPLSCNEQKRTEDQAVQQKHTEDQTVQQQKQKHTEDQAVQQQKHTMDQPVQQRQGKQQSSAKSKVAEASAEVVAVEAAKKWTMQPKSLPNLGNTCFFNSTMQCLLTTWPFLQHYFDIVTSMPSRAMQIPSPFRARVGDTEVKVPKMEVHLSHDFPMPTFWVFAKFVDNFHKDDTKRAQPGALFEQISKKVPRFRGMAQQDAHELFHYLMNMLHQEELARFEHAFDSVQFEDDDEDNDSSSSCDHNEDDDGDEDADDEMDGGEQGQQTAMMINSDKKQKHQQQGGHHQQQQQNGQQRRYSKNMTRQQQQQRQNNNTKKSSSSNNNNTNSSNKREERRRRLICQTLLAGPARPVLNAIYGGVLQQSIKCDRCGHVSLALEPFFDLTLSVKSVAAAASSGTYASTVSAAAGAPRVLPSLADTLRLFTAAEVLRGDTHAYRCENCTKPKPQTSSSSSILKSHQQQKEGDKNEFIPPPPPANALKRYRVLSAPLVLTLHLNRFEQVGALGYKLSVGRNLRKFNGHIQFPLLLNLAPFCSSNVKCIRPGQNRRLLLYRLCGVVSHSGGMGGGHYIAYVGRYPPRSDGDGSHCQPVDSLFELALHSSTLATVKQLADKMGAIALEKKKKNIVATNDNGTAAHDDDDNGRNSVSSDDTMVMADDEENATQIQEIEQQALDAAKHRSKWFYCSDTHVRSARVDEVLSAQAFLLFYERIY